MAVVDLTHTLDRNIPTWTGSEGVQIGEITHAQGDLTFVLNQFKKYATGVGTHVDMPAHLAPLSLRAHKVSPEDLLAPLCVLHLGTLPPKTDIGDHAVLEFEDAFGRIPAGAWVFFHTGWGKTRWKKGHDAYVGGHTYPALTEDVSKLLLRRHILGIGIDTISPDREGGSFPTHHHLLSAGKFIVENLTHLDAVPSTGYRAWVIPLKAPLTESPARVLAFPCNKTT